VIQGPGPGEDAALVEIGDEVWAVACDPVTFTSDNAGQLAVVVNANDVAVMGAEPRFFLATILVAPHEAWWDDISTNLEQIRVTCERLGVALIGGHCEVTPGLPRSMVVGTMMGPVRGRPITSSGLQDGDWVGMTKWAALEGTSILLSDFADRLGDLGAGEPSSVEEVLPPGWLSVVRDARVAAAIDGVTAMHDVTEGGVGEALYELARASGEELAVAPAAIPVLPETRRICRDLGIDPLGLIGSGALLVGCREECKDELAGAYARHGIPFSWIGRAVAPDPGQARVPRFPQDEILKTRLFSGVDGVVFDMDGTLVDSRYDWDGIRSELEIDARSIIDALNGMESPAREQKWRRLEEIERQATEEAGLKPGARELLGLLERRGIHTALVTNNSAGNARTLLNRFRLQFDVILTRDDGFWKPSGAPVAEAIRRLGVPPERCVAVGDARHDLEAGRDAGCRVVVILHDPSGELAAEADLAFPEIDGFVRYLQIVLG
jgi:HAD superfamily hydrolase (TIGR01509 family)